MSDAAELEREAEAARARLSATADQLKARMSPGQLMDEVLNQFRDGDGNRMLANLHTQARDNPMALALVGSGLAWLMMGSGAAKPAASAGTGGAGAYLRRSPDGASRPETAGATGTAAEAPSSARRAVGESRDSASSSAAGSAQDLRAAVEDGLADIGHGAADLGHQAQRTLADVLEREPLVIGALGLAVGAAIGALLPASELERQHLGSTGEALRDEARALLDRGMDTAKEAAAEVYETARGEADRQGLVSGDRPLAGKIDAVVRAAGTAASEIAEKPFPVAEGGKDRLADPEGGNDPRAAAVDDENWPSPAEGDGDRFRHT